MGNTDEAYVLIDGAGTEYGAYLLEDLSADGTHIGIDGKSRHIEFSISLARQDDDQASSMAQKEVS